MTTDWWDGKTLVITGAGVSASAGIKTYRDDSGLWSDQELMRMSHSRHYGNFLKKLQPFWAKLAEQMSAAEPTLFHRELAKKNVRIITQNVDGLHQRAGSSEVLEIHGNMLTWRPLQKRGATEPIDWKNIQLGQKVRPDIVLFGEQLHHRKQVREWLHEAERILYAGTSGNVFPVADWYKDFETSALVDPQPWGHFTHQIVQTTDDWAQAGMPI